MTNEAAQRMRQTYEVTGDRWFKIAADQLDAAVMAKMRLESFADQANAGQVHYSARELKRKIWAAFSDFENVPNITLGEENK